MAPASAPVVWRERLLFAILFAVLGTLIMVVFSPWRPLLQGRADYGGRIALSLLLVAAASLLGRSRRYALYAPAVAGLAILTVAVSLDLIFGLYLLDHLAVDTATPAGRAMLKLNEGAVVFGVVIIGTLLSGQGLRSLYLQRGKLSLGLTIGLAAFAIAIAGAFPVAESLFGARDLTPARVLPWLPWLLIYVLANAALEELLFRGLFLRRLSPLVGPFLASLLVAIVFTLLHHGVTYTADERVFLAIVLPLALVWGWLVQKTEGLWASILFHAGTDIPLVLGIFSQLA